MTRSFSVLSLLALVSACGGPTLAKDGTLVFPQGGSGAGVLTANGIEYRDRNDIPQPVLRRTTDEPWRAPIGFILPKDGKFTKAAQPTVLATQGLAIVLRPSDTRVPSWGGEVLVRVDVIAPAAEGTARYGENVAIVIDGEGADAADLVDVALGQLAGRDRVTILDARGAKVIVPLMPATNRSMAVAALKNHLKNKAQPARDTASTLRVAGTMLSVSAVTQRILILSDRGADKDAVAKLTQRGVQVAEVSTSNAKEDFAERSEAVREAVPQAGLTAFRDVRLSFEGSPAPSHVLEVSGGEARWHLDGGDLVIGNVRAGEARTEMVRVSVPAWTPNENFRFTVQAHVDDLAYGGPRDFQADVPCIYDDDIERIAKSRHGDVIAYASAMATLKRLDEAFVGADVDRAGGLRKVAELHASSMQALARDTHDFAIQEQADLLTALLQTTK